MDKKELPWAANFINQLSNNTNNYFRGDTNTIDKLKPVLSVEAMERGESIRPPNGYNLSEEYSIKKRKRDEKRVKIDEARNQISNSFNIDDPPINIHNERKIPISTLKRSPTTVNLHAENSFIPIKNEEINTRTQSPTNFNQYIKSIADDQDEKEEAFRNSPVNSPLYFPGGSKRRRNTRRIKRKNIKKTKKHSRRTKNTRKKHKLLHKKRTRHRRK